MHWLISDDQIFFWVGIAFFLPRKSIDRYIYPAFPIFRWEYIGNIPYIFLQIFYTNRFSMGDLNNVGSNRRCFNNGYIDFLPLSFFRLSRNVTRTTHWKTYQSEIKFHIDTTMSVKIVRQTRLDSFIYSLISIKTAIEAIWCNDRILRWENVDTCMHMKHEIWKNRPDAMTYYLENDTPFYTPGLDWMIRLDGMR